jgi:hypothetical protein
MMDGQSAQQIGQRRTVCLAQWREKVLSMGPRRAADVSQDRLTRLGDMERGAATIVPIATPLDQSPAFELIDKNDQAARQQTQLTGHRLLRTTRRGRNHAQQTSLRRSNPSRSDPIGEAHRRQPADLRHQKSQLT